MNRGPLPSSRPSGPTFADKAATAWSPMPDWVAELAAVADRDGLAGPSKILGYSRSAISAVINGKYGGDLGRFGDMVRGALMAATVDCPVLGDMARNVCLDWQKRPYTDVSAMHIRMWRACRACPIAKPKKEDAA